MTISERIFLLLREKDIKQKDFSDRTGISESTISDWKRKQTNPSADKIMKICEVLEVSPYELLMGDEGSKIPEPEKIVVEKGTCEYAIVNAMKDMDRSTKERMLGYVEALSGR